MVEFYHLQGSPEKIGNDYAEQIKDNYENTAIIFFKDFIKKTIYSSLSDSPQLARDAAFKFVENFYVKRIIKRIPDDEVSLYRSMARVFKLPLTTVLGGFAAPDVYNILMVKSLYKKNVTPALGCSTVIAKGDATSENNFIFARNLDFPGLGYWDLNHAVHLIEKTGKIPYLGITSKGALTGGITGMNLEGLIVSLHFNCSVDINLNGCPILYISNKILEEARSIEEAVEIVDRFKRTSGWTINIADTKGRTAVSVEVSANRTGIREMTDNTFWSLNNYTTAELKKTEIPSSETLSRLNNLRNSRLLELTLELNGSIDPKNAVNILSDKFDIEYDEMMSVSDTISQHYNISSVIFDIGNDTIHIADEVAPVNLSHEYKSFNINDLFSGKFEQTGSIMNDSPFLNTEKYYALQKYIESYKFWYEENDLDMSANLMQDAVDIDDTEPMFYLILGGLYLKKLNLNAALEAFERAVDCSKADLHMAKSLFWTGVAYDILKKRSKAKDCYYNAGTLLGKNDILNIYIRKGLKYPYGKNSVKKIKLNYLSGDMFF
ncbi:C45 family autoproteolytic acyltransferase/hydrolase [candidate division KSB1 bacterium]